MAYIFYFFGFVQAWKLSEYFSEDDSPVWYHFVVALIWPSIVVLMLVYDLKLLIMGDEEEEQ